MADKGGLPLGSTILNPLEYMKKAWSGFNLPTQFAPTLDLAELDRRITDLKAVEQWLNLNQNLLRNTIQGLEIQRGTIATVAAFGQAVHRTGDAMAGIAQRAREASPSRSSRGGLFSTPARSSKAPDDAAPAEPPAPDAAGERSPRPSTIDAATSFFTGLSRLSALSGFGGFGGAGAATRGSPADAAASDASSTEARSAPQASPSSDRAPTSAQGPADASPEAAEPAADAGAAESGTNEAPGGKPPPSARTMAASALSNVGEMAEALASNASSAWWKLLQGQFDQIITAATSPTFPTVFGPPGDTPAADASAQDASPDARKPGRSPRGAKPDAPAARRASGRGSAPESTRVAANPSPASPTRSSRTRGTQAGTRGAPAPKRATRSNEAATRDASSRDGARAPSAGKRSTRRAK
ncbi:MAG: hypothetical protein QM674_15520 [Burkholderiaceae bacterium]